MLRDHAGRQYASRVEDLAAGLVVVARPHDLPDEALGAGTEVDVTWSTSMASSWSCRPASWPSTHATGGRSGHWR